MADIVNDQSPTAAQHSEFWQQVDKGLITKKNFQEFLEKKKIDANLFPQETSHLRLVNKGVAPSGHKFYNYEQIEDGNYAEIIGSIDQDLNLPSFETDKQLEQFMIINSELFHPNYTTHFLWKDNDNKSVLYFIHGNFNSMYDLRYQDSSSKVSTLPAGLGARFLIFNLKTLES